MSDTDTRARYSFSALTKYRDCPRAFYYRYRDQGAPKAPQGGLIGGRTVHEVIEVDEQHGWWDCSILDGEAIERGNYFAEFEFRKRFLISCAEVGTPINIDGEIAGFEGIRWGGRKTKEFPGGEDYRWWGKWGPTMLKRFNALRRHDRDSGQMLTSETVEFEVSAELHGMLIRGFLDALVYVNDDGERVIRDYKTGVYEPTPEQLAIYAWTLEKGPGLIARTGEYVMLRRNESADRIKRYDLTDLVDLVGESFVGLDQQIAVSDERNVWPVHPSNFCASCESLPACDPGRRYLIAAGKIDAD